jgi:hypothetical protein
MESRIAEVVSRYLMGTGLAGHCACGGTCGGCGRKLGTGNDPSVRRALDEIADREPPDFTAYMENLRDLSRVAEADVAIAIARPVGYVGTLVYTQGETSVRFDDAAARPAGSMSIRYEPPDLDPAGRGEPRAWVLDVEVPERLGEMLARFAPSWVMVQRLDESGAPRLLRAAQHKRAPSQWWRRFPTLQKPAHEGEG